MPAHHAKLFVSQTPITYSPVKIGHRNFPWRLGYKERARPTEVWTFCLCNFLELSGHTPISIFQVNTEMLQCIIYSLSCSHKAQLIMSFSVLNVSQCPVIRCSIQELCLRRRITFPKWLGFPPEFWDFVVIFLTKSATVFVVHWIITGSVGS